MEVASTKYPWHKTHTKWGLTSVSFTLPPIQGTTGSLNKFFNTHGCDFWGDDDEDMAIATATIFIGYTVSILYTDKKIC
jgi:hypothetical protein